MNKSETTSQLVMNLLIQMIFIIMSLSIWVIF